MKKILEVNVDDRGLGGVYGLVKNIIQASPEDVRIDIACLETFENKENIKELNRYGSHVYYVGYNGNKLKKQAKIYKNLKALIADQHYDTVHIHADVANKLLVSGYAAKHSGVKQIILHSHATGTDGAHRARKEKIHKLCRTKLPKIGTDFATCSDLAAKWMFPSIPKSQITQINNGIDLPKFRFSKEQRTEIREELQLSERFVIGHVGRFMYQKNHAYLIKMFAELYRTWKQEPIGREPVLFLVGDGELKAEIAEETKRLGIAHAVIFHGLSGRVNALMQAMDVFVLPSHFEGLPIVGVEAQAAGLPVVFSDQITREAELTNEVTYLPITEDAIGHWVRTVLHYETFERYDTYERLKAEGYQIEDTVNKLLALYGERA